MQPHLEGNGWPRSGCKSTCMRVISDVLSEVGNKLWFEDPDGAGGSGVLSASVCLLLLLDLDKYGIEYWSIMRSGGCDVIPKCVETREENFGGLDGRARLRLVRFGQRGCFCETVDEEEDHIRLYLLISQQADPGPRPEEEFGMALHGQH